MAKKKNKAKSATAAMNAGGGTGGESSLRSLVSELRKENNDNGELIVSTNFILTNISNNIADIAAKIVDETAAGAQGGNLEEQLVAMNFIFRNIANNVADIAEKLIDMPLQAAGLAPNPVELANKEKEKEQSLVTEKQLENQEECKKVMSKSEKHLEEIKNSLKKSGWLDILLGVPAFLVGMAQGFLGSYFLRFKKVFQPVLDFFKSEEGKQSKFVEFMKGAWEKFTTKLSALGKWFSELSIVDKIMTTFKNAWASFTGYFSELKNSFTAITAELENLFGKSTGPGIFERIKNFFVAIGERLRGFLQLGEKLGRFMNLILKPVLMVMSVFDGIQAFMNTEGSIFEKTLEGLRVGIGNFAKAFYGIAAWVGDLIKDVTGWLAGLMGFTDFKKMLDSFSFVEIFEKVIDAIGLGIKRFVQLIADVFTNPEKAMGDINRTIAMVSDWSEKLTKAALRMALPKPSDDKLSVGYWAQKAIPDSLYEYAGLNPKTGAEISAPDSKVQSGALNNVSSENNQVKDEGAAKAAAAAAAASNSSSSKVINNNTTQAAIIASKATNWDPEDQYAMGAMSMMGA